MKTLTFWKGLAIVALLFLFAGMEAAAQLPVRTQVVQWINPAGGTVSFDVNYGAGNSTTDYTVSWPQSTNGTAVNGDQAILLGTYTGPTDINLEWYDIVGFVDGAGAANHVTWWVDDETIVYSDGFEWDETNNVLGVGMNDYAASVANPSTGAAAAGTVNIGDGAASQISLAVVAATSATATIGTSVAGTVNVSSGAANTIILDGAGSTATVGVSATTAGTVNIADNATGLGISLDGDNGTATLGNTTQGGEIIFNDGDATPFTATLSAGDQSQATTVQFDENGSAGGGPFYLPLADNSAAAGLNYILISNGDGTATWSINPAGQIQSGAITPAATNYSGSVVFGTAFTDPDGAGPLTAIPSVVITPNGPNAYVVQVTNITAAGFDWASTAPFDGTDQITWMANVRTQ